MKTLIDQLQSHKDSEWRAASDPARASDQTIHAAKFCFFLF
jgi:hypothetical protein